MASAEEATEAKISKRTVFIASLVFLMSATAASTLASRMRTLLVPSKSPNGCFFRYAAMRFR
jgi:hypothetical protein